MKPLWKLLLPTGLVVGLLQLAHPTIPSRPSSAEIQVPHQVQLILQKDCYSCHSNERRLAWFDEPEPAYWLVRRDVLKAQEDLNFSTIGSKPAAAQKAALYEAVNMIQLGTMPLPRFTALHPDSGVTPTELKQLKAYLAPWGSLPPGAPIGISTSSDRIPMHQAGTASMEVLPESNGIAFDPSFRSWKPLSFTDRGDNNTFRFILGNDIAVRAATEGKISPWPDGTRFAKIAWKQQTSADGEIRPGDFVQVELMIKDAKRYASTEGWGWGRWRGLTLKPYGENARFVNECTTCHLPLKGNDYVYTLPFTNAHVPGVEIANTRAATLPRTLPSSPLGWAPVTMFLDPEKRTLSVLFANSVAAEAVAKARSNSDPPRYMPGAVVSLVTWAERDDPHWFGGRIPDTPLRVEFGTVGPDARNAYKSFTGPTLSVETLSQAVAEQRMQLLLASKPAQLP